MPDNNFGQGLNSLIPRTNKNNQSSLSSNSSNHFNTELEARISKKISQAFSGLPPVQPKEKSVSFPDEQDDYQQSFPDRQDNTLNKSSLKTKDKIFLVEVDKIKPNPDQPRHVFPQDSLQELANSIREYGIIEPLVVTRIEKEVESGTKVEYQLIAGERRWRAAQLLGLPTVPVIIKKPVKESRKLELALVENIQRENLSPIAQAKAFSRLIKEFDLTQQALALKIGKSREVVANSLRLLQLPLEAQRLLDEGKINEGHARAILLFVNPEKRKTFLKEILAKQLSGREAILLAQKYLRLSPSSHNNRARRSVSLDPIDMEWKEKLEDLFQVPIVIKKKGDKGSIEIKFFSKEEMNKVLKKLLPPQL